MILSIIITVVGLSSCKSDSEKLIEKCNAHIAALDSIHSKSDFDKFLETHPNCLNDFLAATRNDSIYAKQDISEAIPYVFNAIYETFDKQEEVLLSESPNDPTAKAIILTGMNVLKLPYCTKVSQLQRMAQELNRTTLPIVIKYMPNSFEMQVLKLGNDWIQSATIRKTEIEEGNLYNSQFLK